MTDDIGELKRKEAELYKEYRQVADKIQQAESDLLKEYQNTYWKVTPPNADSAFYKLGEIEGNGYCFIKYTLFDRRYNLSVHRNNCHFYFESGRPCISDWHNKTAIQISKEEFMKEFDSYVATGKDLF